MNIVLLSGGSGRRLWPLSNEVRSKQFIRLFRSPDGEAESMVQRVYRQITSQAPDADVTIAASKQQLSSIRNQLGDSVSISPEPCRRDTFPAIVLSVSYLVDKKGISPDDPVIICPVDPYVDDEYFRSLVRLEEMVRTGDDGICLLGTEPSFPTAKYGYIIPEDKSDVSRVKRFKEKPSESEAEKLIKEGALWNAGVFAFRAGKVLDIARNTLGYDGYDEFLDRYELLESISFDYAVLEKESDIRVLRFSGEWKDVGTWNTLAETMDRASFGNVIFGGDCEDTSAINDLDIPLICMGLKNVVVAAGPDGILVSDKHQSSYIKPIVDEIAGQIKYSEKSWGSFKVLDSSPTSLTIKVTLLPGHHMYYHSHERRDEVWTVTEGEGVAIVDGVKREISDGDIIKLPAGSRHTVYARTRLEIIEVQNGDDISVSDKIKYEYDFDKI
ncbi:MAG: cupin domain-containing protein [Lachnospiraceae bacterium]|nr:cupin domain-containing protein [Lachnospiraceae bacterium]